MAISAYRGGKLKKRALQGTSLAADEGRSAEREEFSGLYDEAKKYAGDPSKFRSIAESRYETANKPGLSALAQYEGELGTTSSELGDLRSQRSTAQGDIDLSETRGTNVSGILRDIGEGKGKSYRPKRILSRFAKNNPEDVAAVNEYWNTLDPETRKSMVTSAKGEYVPTAENFGTVDFSDLKKRKKVHRATARQRAYVDYLKEKEDAARGTLSTLDPQIESKESRLSDLNKSYSDTYTPLARRASVYGGFFGGL
jgi:hypothetical protein